MTLEKVNSSVMFSTADQRLLDDIYETAYYRVARQVKKYGGDAEDAKDVLHDALIILMKQRARQTPIESELHYLIGIAKHLIHAKIRKRANERQSVELPEIAEEQTTGFASQTRITKLVMTAGKRCLDLLTAAFIEKKPLAVIVNEYGFSSEHSASVRKYKCLEKIRERVKTNGMSYEDFFE